jgi:hypothetical protein
VLCRGGRGVHSAGMVVVAVVDVVSRRHCHCCRGLRHGRAVAASRGSTSARDLVGDIPAKAVR